MAIDNRRLEIEAETYTRLGTSAPASKYFMFSRQNHAVFLRLWMQKFAVKTLKGRIFLLKGKICQNFKFLLFIRLILDWQSLGPISFSHPEPFLRAFDRARRGALAKSITGYHKNMVSNLTLRKQVGNLSEHARRKSIWRHILGVFRGFIWF